MFGIATIDEWQPAPGQVIRWDVSPDSADKAAGAPVNPVPPSFQQAQHLARFADHAARGQDMSRLMIFTWDVAGRCDIRAMTHVLTAHLRRHDTYRSWFERRGEGDFVRHSIVDPADIAVTAQRCGELSADELRELVLGTPDPRQWGGFRFGVIQRRSHFTFFASIAHLYIDPMIMGVLFGEVHMMYGALAGGAAPIKLPQAGSYEEFCCRQREYAEGLTAESPEVRAWIEFAGHNEGSLPDFPLPLGDPAVPCDGATMTATLLDEAQTQRFESACVDGGARFSGGVFAAAAFARHEISGADAFYVVTPTDTRTTPTELVTTGWFTGLVPLAVPISPRSFGGTAAAAQESYDANLGLANVPFARVLQLAPADAGLQSPRPGNFVMSFLDASIAPLSTVANSDLNFHIFNEGRASHQVSMWITRMEHETKLTALFPDNPVARESVGRFVDVMKSVYVRVANGRWADAPIHNVAV
ncbi:condensation domain-containing protein [Mycolicibacterium sp.]|uniref:condensation domain-containing protein n=1 Tax=Mycolicibacterium sp. TaxID=2320850 RepID=UPI00355EB718